MNSSQSLSSPSEYYINRADLDARFLAIAEGMTQTILKTTEQSVSFVMQASASFLSEVSRKTVADFHDLYFSSGDSSSLKDDVNKEVDDLFDLIQEEIKSGKDSNEISKSITEDENKKQARLALSAFQKQLETLITVETGVREKLIPVLVSMQFEDFMRQRLNHIGLIWKDLVGSLTRNEKTNEEISAQMVLYLTSNREKEAFYRLVLKQTPPLNLVDEETWFDLP